MVILQIITMIIALVVLIVLFAIAIFLFLIMLLVDLYSMGIIDECFLCRDKKKGACKTCRFRFIRKRKEGQNEKGTRKSH